MARIVSEFATALTRDLSSSLIPCTVWLDSGERCGQRGGPAQSRCLFGHVEKFTICAECASHRLYCWECLDASEGNVLTIITTEVA